MSGDLRERILAGIDGGPMPPEVYDAIADLAREPGQAPTAPPLTRWHWWCLISAAQLASRHPEFAGAVAHGAAEAAKAAQLLLFPSGPLATLAELGWDPQHDG